MGVRSGLSRVWVFLRDKVGLHGLGLVASLIVIAFAATVLYRMLHDLKLADVVKALSEKNPLHVAVAFLLVACAYLTLTFYDWFALRTIGKTEVPYRVAALSGFCSYSIGHNVGFTVFTGGSVRYRIYSAWGLGAIDVAKLCFIAGLTFWLGNLAVLGLGITIHPDAATAVDRLPPAVNRAIGIGALLVLAAYVAWVSAKPRNIGRSSWFVTLPAGRSTLVQMGIGILDLSLCAAAMYMLMPAQPYIDPVSLAVIFVTATLLGFASHAPGGLGVFDAALLMALPQFDKGEMVGALLIFRLFYYIVPFALALTLLGVRELRLGTFGFGGAKDGAVPAPEETVAEEVPPVASGTAGDLARRAAR
ncbi:UPF0104 family protein [Xanthobacter sediminis]